MTPGTRRTAAMMGVVGVAYLAAAVLGSALSSRAAFATLWPPNGVLVAALLRSDSALWPYFILATCPANVAFNAWRHLPLLLGLAYWMGNVAESLAVAGVLRRLHGRVAFDRLSEVVTFVAAATLCTMLGATIGAAASHAWTPASSFADVWRSWWIADLLGLLIVVPVIVSYPGGRAGADPARLSKECGVFAVVLGLVVGATVLAPAMGFDPRSVLQPLIVPLLGWSALRLGVPGTSWALLGISVLVVLNHVRGLGEFVGPLGYTPQRAVVVQAVLSGVSVTFLCVAAALQETRASTRRLVRRDESRQAFVAAMTHEIRNPLEVILASVEVADAGPDAAPTQPVDPLRAIERAARQILEVVEDVLEVSQLEADRPGARLEPVWLPALWRDLHVECQAMPRAPQVVLHWTTASDVSLMVDRKRLVTMLRNLVGNALKFTDRGHVRVTCRVREDAVAFVVEDTGIGVSTEDQGRIFQLYQRGSGAEAERRHGTGVGLYLVRRYAEECGATVAVESVLRKGSTFTLTLPRAIVRSRIA